MHQPDDQWRMQFEKFEKYAEKLTQDSNELKAKIEREKKEAKRLSAGESIRLAMCQFRIDISRFGEVCNQCKVGR